MKPLLLRTTTFIMASVAGGLFLSSPLSAGDAIGPYVRKGESGNFKFAVYNNRWLLHGKKWAEEKDLTRVAITGISEEAKGKIVIPTKIEGLEVYGIDDNAFAKSGEITSIEIPATVEFLKPGAINRCSGLENIIIAEGHPTFASVDGLMFDKTKTKLLAVPTGRKGEFNVPANTVEIGPSAFSLCTQLESIIIPDGVTDIGGRTGSVFLGCSALAKISIPDTVTNIGQKSFQDCSNLKEVEVPPEVTEVPFGLFWRCGNLTKVTLPEGITSIGNYAFADCTNLNLEKLPDALTKIGAYAFKNCKAITRISMPKTLNEIGKGAFSGSGVKTADG